MIHSCPTSVKSKVSIRQVSYGDRRLWQTEAGKSIEFDIRYCPYCGDQLTGGPLVTSPIPTAMTPAEREALQSLAAGRNVLEIGSLFGYSTIALAEVANVVWAVDPHDGYPLSNPRPTLQQFTANLKRSGVRNVIPVIAKGQSIIEQLPVGYFDLVFIDCSRDAGELITMVSKLRPEFIAVHDYGHPEWTGATIAVDEFLKRSARWLKTVDSLAILTWPWKESKE